MKKSSGLLCKRALDKYIFIFNELKEYPLWISCRVLQVSRSGYYKWLKKACIENKKPEEEKTLEMIRKYHRLSKGRYGLLRIYKAIRNKEGMAVNRKRVYRLMKKYEIYSKTVKKFKVTTKTDKKGEFSPNLVNGNFAAESENELWTSDITYLWTNEGWMYLSVILDVFNREIIGWSVKDRLTTDIVVNSLNMALINRDSSIQLLSKPIIFHSDRGSQYTSKALRKLLPQSKFTQSMSSTGNCYDNAITETFFSSLKKELVYLTSFETKEQAKQLVFEYIEIFYNRQRLHSALNYMSPVEYGVVKRKDFNSKVA